MEKKKKSMHISRTLQISSNLKSSRAAAFLRQVGELPIIDAFLQTLYIALTYEKTKTQTHDILKFTMTTGPEQLDTYSTKSASYPI